MKPTSNTLAWVCVIPLGLYPFAAIVWDFLAPSNNFGIVAALLAANAGTALLVRLVFDLPELSDYTSRKLKFTVLSIGVASGLASAVYSVVTEVDHVWLLAGIISPVLFSLFVLIWFVDKVEKEGTKQDGAPQGLSGDGENPSTSLTTHLALKGSQRWLQLIVNRCPDTLDEAIAKAIGLEHGETIEWLSPLESDCFAEYRDHAFLDRLGIIPQCQRLVDFWPKGGPIWDGLAQTSGGHRLLIEAKANIPELDTSPTRASGKSLRKIRKAFDETKGFLRVNSKVDWSGCFYQYANRLAHLYFLRECNQVNATLVFVYFVNDTTVPGTVPVSREGWEASVQLANHHLGIRSHTPWIRENVVCVFIEVNDLSDVAWP